MPAIPYLEGSESITAARLNLIVVEADRKLALAFSDHSMLLWLRFGEGLFPHSFCFFDAKPGILRPRTLAANGVNYSHAPFVEAAQNTPVDDSFSPFADDALQVLRIKPPTPDFFAGSMEAHVRIYGSPPKPYWLLSASADFRGVCTNLSVPLNYAQADLIYDGENFKTVDFPAHYDRFNMFRIHNLGSDAMMFGFVDENSAVIFSLEVPAGGSRCVRRDDVGSGYLLGGQHFQYFKSGDHRFFSGTPPVKLSEFASVAEESVNNIVNPNLIATIFKRLINSTGVPGAVMDATKLWDASGKYCQTP